MSELIEVRFKGNRKDFFAWDNRSPLEIGTPVVVEVDRGRDLGHGCLLVHDLAGSRRLKTQARLILGVGVLANRVAMASQR